MKVSILSYDLSHNCLGRAYVLAKMLSNHYEVEIIGPSLGNGIWSPVEFDTLIKYKVLKRNTNIFQILHKIDGDIVYAIKPKMTSFGYGLLKKYLYKCPLILDVDDWELGFFLDASVFSRMLSSLNIFNTNNYIYTVLLELFTKCSNSITVSSTFLQKKFGGVIVPHARDTNAFDPSRYNKSELRIKYNIKNNQKVILFLGTPIKHKGLGNIVKALDLLNDKNFIFLIIGAENVDNNCVPKRSYIRLYKPQPFSDIPKFLALSDLVVLPQELSNSSIGQIPAKIFDAMAMAKPIIATRISDLPQILKGCGFIVEPNNVSQLAENIRYVLSNPKIAIEMGRKAREKCIEKYSFISVEKTLLKEFDKYKIKQK